MTEVIAHRGASASEPENTLTAFRRAVEMGADAIEFDINHTRDNELAVWHDRLAAGAPLRGMTLDELRGRTLAGDGGQVPVLSEALEAVPPTVTMYIEIKTLNNRSDDALIETVRRSDHPLRCAVHAFDHRIIERLRGKAPDIPSGVLSSSYPVDPVSQMTASGATTLWQHQHHVDAELLDAVHGARGRVIVWTVDDQDDMRRFIDLGVDGICTNTPDVLRSIIS